MTQNASAPHLSPENQSGEDLKKYIRAVPDFPKPGILFYDISPLLADKVGWKEAVNQLKAAVKDYKPDLLAGIESRGFLAVAPLALELGIGFIMVRKKGKLPGKVISYEYDLEYGTDIVEIQADAIEAGQKVVVLDDVMATGGTLSAAIDLLQQAGADVVSAACLMELSFLNGREKLKKRKVPFHSLMRYDS